VKTTKVKLLTATAGAGALLAMGGVTVATSVAEPATPGPVTPTEITTGETTIDQMPATTTTTPASLSVEPEIRGPAPLPSEQADAQ
jgi:hypothetical protein